MEIGVPPRSPCYSLPLYRQAGIHPECLTSYVLRLAEAHRVTPVALVRELFPSMVGKFYDRIGFDKPLRSGHTINGVGTVAQDWTHALMTLTGRSDLAVGTLQSWQGWIPVRGLLAPSRRWCPVCYGEAREHDQPLTDALYWAVASVSVCVLHQVALVEACPACARSVPWLPAGGVPGHCPRCGADLDHAMEQRVESPWDMWVASTIADELAHPPRIARSTTTPAQRLQALIGRSANGQAASLARLIGYPKNTVSGWLTGVHHPSLDAILRLCWVSDQSLSQWLRGIGTAPQHELRPAPTRSPACRRSPHPFPDQAAIAILESWTAPPPDERVPSSRQLAAMLGVDRRMLTYKVGSRVGQVALARAQWRQRQRHSRDQAIDTWMRETVNDLVAHGTYPGQRSIEAQLPPGWSFHEATVRRIWHRVREEALNSAHLRQRIW